MAHKRMEYKQQSYNLPPSGKSYLCPFCGNKESIKGSSVEVEDTECYQERWCRDCGKSWTNEYTLTAFLFEE